MRGIVAKKVRKGKEGEAIRIGRGVRENGAEGYKT